MAHESFISYSSKHRELTHALAAAIETQHGAGSVWWDQALEARRPCATQIRSALDAARVVVMIWSAGALVSEYVLAEATLAHAALKLVNVRPAHTALAQIPAPLQRATAPEHSARSVARVAPLLDALVQGHLRGWAPAVVAAIIETPGDLLPCLQAQLASLDGPALVALDAALPIRSLALDPLATAVAWRLLEQDRADPAPPRPARPCRAVAARRLLEQLGAAPVGPGSPRRRAGCH